MKVKIDSISSENLLKLGFLNFHILESMKDWVRVSNATGETVFVNRALREYYEISYDVLGDGYYVIPGDEELSLSCIESKQSKQKEIWIENRRYSIKASPILDDKGDAFAAVEVYRDLTIEENLEIELRNKNALLEKDLIFAKNIQRKILPTRTSYGNLNMDFLYEPSELLSGDVFDIFFVDKDKIGMYVADVSGHGVAAAMITMYIKQAIRSIKEYHVIPSCTLKELYLRFNKLDLEIERYFTCFYAVYDMKTELLTYSNAGHNCPPIVYNDSGLEILEQSGYPIFSLLKDVSYTDGVIPFKKGDKLLLYTDGITENKDNEGNLFGVEGLVKLVEESPNSVLESISRISQYNKWGEHEDDYAAILIERT